MSLPLCWFGAVPFAMIVQRGSDAPDWTPDLKVVSHHMAGGTVTETEVIGQGRMTITALLRFASATEYVAFLAKAGTVDSLTMRHAATAFPGDFEGQDVDGLYKRFDSVLLTAPLDRPTRRLNGVVDVPATFERDPL